MSGPQVRNNRTTRLPFDGSLPVRHFLNPSTNRRSSPKQWLGLHPFVQGWLSAAFAPEKIFGLADFSMANASVCLGYFFRQRE